MKRLTSEQLFGAPKSARKTKARLARAKLLVVAVRERAAVTAQRYAAQALTMCPMRPPTVLHRRRLAERLNAKPWFGLFPTPSPPAEKATARQDQAGQTSAHDGTGNAQTNAIVPKAKAC